MLAIIKLNLEAEPEEDPFLGEFPCLKAPKKAVYVSFHAKLTNIPNLDNRALPSMPCAEPSMKQFLLYFLLAFSLHSTDSFNFLQPSLPFDYMNFQYTQLDNWCISLQITFDREILRKDNDVKLGMLIEPRDVHAPISLSDAELVEGSDSTLRIFICCGMILKTKALLHLALQINGTIVQKETLLVEWSGPKDFLALGAAW